MVKVDGALHGEGLGLLHELVATLVDPWGPAGLRVTGQCHRHASDSCTDGEQKRGGQRVFFPSPGEGSGCLRVAQ